MQQPCRQKKYKTKPPKYNLRGAMGFKFTNTAEQLKQVKLGQTRLKYFIRKRYYVGADLVTDLSISK